jgi:hypothetical protein
MGNIRDMLLWWSRPSTMSDYLKRPTEYIAPSCSWASPPHTIKFGTLANSYPRGLNEGRLTMRYLARISSITAEGDTPGQLHGGCLIVVGPTITLKPVGALWQEDTTDGFLRSGWYLACEKSSTVCSAIPHYELEFVAMIRTSQKVTGLLWDMIPDRTRVQEDSWFHSSSYSSHIIIIQQQDPPDENLYRRVGIAFINWSYQVKNASPLDGIGGMKSDWRLGKNWFKDAVLKRLTIM